MTSKNIFLIFLLINNFYFLNLISGLLHSKPRKIHAEKHEERKMFGEDAKDSSKEISVDVKKDVTFVNDSGRNLQILVTKKGCCCNIKKIKHANGSSVLVKKLKNEDLVTIFSDVLEERIEFPVNILSSDNYRIIRPDRLRLKMISD